ncbi:hypothetical protein [Salinicola peritrichatus]|uniref:hypothetical protein n=1 Tax=Salinicola peritrichatus TaxID=1267424 RepID=UPI000DA25AAF|nr:hypothetical protein [Salinicola peritrichatus]
MNNVDTAIEQEIRTLLDAYEHQPKLRSDIRKVLLAHESGQEMQRLLDNYARRKAAHELLESLFEGPTPRGRILLENWFVRVMNRRDVPHTRANEALLGSAYENFEDVLSVLGITRDDYQAALNKQSPNENSDQKGRM